MAGTIKLEMKPTGADPETTPRAVRTDQEIVHEVGCLLDSMGHRVGGVDLTISVAGGVVSLRGRFSEKGPMDAFASAVARIEGVVGVRNNLVVEVGDASLAPMTA